MKRQEDEHKGGPPWLGEGDERRGRPQRRFFALVLYMYHEPS